MPTIIRICIKMSIVKNIKTPLDFRMRIRRMLGMQVIETTTRVIDIDLLKRNMERSASMPEELKIWENCLNTLLKDGTLMFRHKIRTPGIRKYARDRFEIVVNMSVKRHTVSCTVE